MMNHPSDQERFVTRVPLVVLSSSEFSVELNLLREKGSNVVPSINVPMVDFVYLCPDFYKAVRAAHLLKLKQQSKSESPLFQVFDVLDLVCPTNQFEWSNAKENEACAAFACWNNLPVLTYLWEKGFSWSENTLFAAVQAKSVHCFMFAVEKECPLQSYTRKQFAKFVSRFGTQEMFYFIDKQSKIQ
jgi:hypothetical protein